MSYSSSSQSYSQVCTWRLHMLICRRSNPLVCFECLCLIQLLLFLINIIGHCCSLIIWVIRLSVSVWRGFVSCSDAAIVWWTAAWPLCLLAAQTTDHQALTVRNKCAAHPMKWVTELLMNVFFIFIFICDWKSKACSHHPSVFDSFWCVQSLTPRQWGHFCLTSLWAEPSNGWFGGWFTQTA